MFGKRLWQTFIKSRSHYNWEHYRKQMNKVVSLRKKSKNNFMKKNAHQLKWKGILAKYKTTY
jgi:hypothetical protein